jgi:hypothetical protein
MWNSQPTAAFDGSGQLLTTLLPFDEVQPKMIVPGCIAVVTPLVALFTIIVDDPKLLPPPPLAHVVHVLPLTAVHCCCTGVVGVVPTTVIVEPIAAFTTSPVVYTIIGGRLATGVALMLAGVILSV